MRLGFVLICATFLFACGSNSDDPAVRYEGTVLLADDISLAEEPHRLAFSAGPSLTVTPSLGGPLIEYDSWDGAMFSVQASDFPYEFIFADMGVPFSGRIIATLDMDGDEIVSIGDAYDVISFTEDEFNDGWILTNLQFTLHSINSR